MTRDQLASAALSGLLQAEALRPNVQDAGPPAPGELRGDPALVARSYALADEMLRQQKPDEDGFSKIFELACAAGDVWIEYWKLVKQDDRAAIRDFMPKYAEVLSRLEEATRSCATRKVRS